MPSKAATQTPQYGALEGRPRAYVTIPEAAEHFGVSIRTCRALIASGELEAVRLGPRAVRIPVTALTRAGRPYAAPRRRASNTGDAA